MIFGESFEEPAGTDGVSGSENNRVRGGGITWTKWGSGTASGYNVSADAMNGLQSQVMSLAAGSTHTSVLNYGLDTQGMALQAGLSYGGYLYLKASAAAQPVMIAVALVSAPGSDGNVRVLSQEQFEVGGGGPFLRFNFTLRPNASTGCRTAPAPRTSCKPNPEQACIECDGAFAVRLLTPGSVTIDYVFLQTDAWGRFDSLPTRKDLAENLVELGPRGLGFTTLRLGGSM